MTRQTHMRRVRLGSGLVMILALLSVAVPGSHAAGPGRPASGPGAPATTPTPYFLYGDTANSGVATTTIWEHSAQMEDPSAIGYPTVLGGGITFNVQNPNTGFVMGVSCAHTGSGACNGLAVDAPGGAVAVYSDKCFFGGPDHPNPGLSCWDEPNPVPNAPPSVQGYAYADDGVGVRGDGGAADIATKNYWKGYGVAAEGNSYGGLFTATDPASGIGLYGEGSGNGIHGEGAIYGGHFVSNNGTGAGGTSTSGPGVWGVSYSGVTTPSVGYGVLASSANNNGIYATSTGAGVGGIGGQAPDYGAVFTATNASGIGVVGNATGTSGAAGVQGSTTAQSAYSYGGRFTATAGTGLYGYSASGSAATGFSDAGVGVSGSAAAGFGVRGFSSSSYGVQGWGGTTGSNIGVKATSVSSTGLYATSVYSAAVSVTTSSGPFGLWAGNGTAGANHWAVQADGNVTVNGSLWTKYHVGPLNPASGAANKSSLYSATATQQMVTEYGTATLEAGRAVIRFDPLYAQTVDLAAGYQVYVTPGTLQTHGLRVVNRTATGFEVQEVDGGHGSFRVDWRVNAPRQGHAGERLAPAPPIPPSTPPAARR